MLMFISMFGFIGLAVLIFVWSQSPHEFGAPPLFFRVFASFIAIAFMAVGFGVPINALRQRAGGGSAAGGSAQPPEPGTGYKCPHCGAGLGKEAEVSPSGDVKCGYCHKWWNIHRGAV
jgi:hypothetical protein